MSRYFFDVKNGHRLIDPAGLDCRDEGEAIEAGTVIAHQIAADAPPNGPRHVAVLNSDRQEVGRVPINSDSPAFDGRNDAMPNPTKEQIIAHAYHLWQKAGEPAGRDEEFYHQAEQELRNEDASSPLRTPDTL